MLVTIGMHSAHAQKERSLLRKGNKAYEQEDFEAAIKLYQESLEENGSYGKAAFNLGNGFYKKGDLGQASKQYEMAAADAFSKEEKANAFHNVGNSFLSAARHLMENPPQENDSVQAPDPQQLIRASIEAYKKSLRNVPTDEETRYNLAYAQKLLKEGGGGGEGQDDNQQDQQNQDQQNQDQENQDQGDQDKQDDQQSNEDGDKENEQEQQSERPNEMTKEEAEQLLKALDKNEKDLQEKLAKDRMEKGEPVKIEKDW